MTDDHKPCPAPGLCLTLETRLVRLETERAESGKTGKAIAALGVALLGVTVVHLGAFLVWKGQADERFQNTAVMLAEIKVSDKWQTEQIIRGQMHPP